MRIVLCILLLLFNVLCAEKAVFIEGYLGQEQIADIETKLHTLVQPKIVLIVESNGGSFFDVLRVCQYLQKRRANGAHITMLLNKRAIGPAALLPFLADNLYVTPGSVWGNIPYGLDNSVPREVMNDAIRGLIPQGSEEKSKEQIAEAMIDPYSQVSGMTFSSDPLILSSEQIIGLDYGKLIGSIKQFLIEQKVQLSDEETSSITLNQVKNVVSEKDLEQSFKTNIHFDADLENYIGYIRYDSPISKSSYLQTKFAIQYFQTFNVRCIVLDINVSNGDIFSAIKIADLLEKADANMRIPILAYINEKALSPGALLAYACRYIIVNPASTIGSSEKLQSHAVYSLLGPEFARAASFWGRNSTLAEAMVNKNTILVLRNHQIKQLSSESETIKTGPDPDVIITGKGDFLLLKGEKIYDLGIANGIVEKITSITPAEYANETWPADKSAVFSLPYLNTMKNAIMVAYSGWKVQFFSFLTHSTILALLFFGLLVGFYLELNTPGFGILGTIGLFCFVLIIWGTSTVYSIHWTQWAILGIGLLFFAIELFFIPGFGWTGITGITFILLALASFSLPNIGSLDLTQWNTFSLVFRYVLPQFLWILGGLIAGAIVIYILAKFFSKRVLNLSKLTIHGNQSLPEGVMNLQPDIEMPEIGALGESFTALKPSGKVRVGNEIFDAVTQTGFIDKEVPITVVRIEGMKLIVRQIEEEE